MSRLRATATTIIAVMSSITTLTGSCDDVSMWRLITSTTRGDGGRRMNAARPRAVSRKAIRRSVSVVGLAAPRKIVTASTGPNSPTAPAEASMSPKRVPSIWRSCSMGMSVPMAVVVRASPISSSDRTKPVATMTPATTSATTTDAPHPIAARLNGVPRMRAVSIS